MVEASVPPAGVPGACTLQSLGITVSSEVFALTPDANVM